MRTAQRVRERNIKNNDLVERKRKKKPMNTNPGIYRKFFLHLFFVLAQFARLWCLLLNVFFFYYYFVRCNA